MSMELDEEVGRMTMRQMDVTNDGAFCAIGGGSKKPYWYLIDIVNGTQTKLKSQVLRETYCPCFINGAADQIAIGGEGKVEIWDLATKTSINVLDVNDVEENSVRCTYSVHNVFAVGTHADRMLRVFDVRAWNQIFSKQFEMKLQSLHLTADLKYLTVAGWDGEMCLVLESK